MNQLIKGNSGNEKPEVKTEKKGQRKDTRIVEKVSYRCTCCGKEYNAQRGHFFLSKSNLFSGNNGYMSICKSCLGSLYLKYFSQYDGNNQLAVERICQIGDIYISKKTLDTVKSKFAKDRFLTYLSKYTGADNGKSYKDYVAEQLESYLKEQEAHENQIAEYEEQIAQYLNEISELKDELETVTSLKDQLAKMVPDADEILGGKYVPTKETIRRFGVGFPDMDYETMQLEYDDWVSKHGKPMDKRQEELYTTICYMKLNLQRNVQTGTGNIGSLSSAYKSFIEAATTEIEDRKKKMEQEMENKPLGMLIRDIENYCPAEYYKDKKIYDDFDYLKDYVERFMTRPLRNLLTGSKEQDKEFSLPEGGDGQT